MEEKLHERDILAEATRAYIQLVFAQIQVGLALRQGVLGLLQRALGLLNLPRTFPQLCLLLCHLRCCPGRRLRTATVYQNANPPKKL